MMEDHETGEFDHQNSQETSPSESGHPPPESDAFNQDARQWAMFCHLASLAQFLGPSLLNIIGPLVVWLIKKEEYPFVDEHGKESLNFQISMSIYLWVSSAILAITCVGMFLIPFTALAIVAMDIVYAIIAAMKANNGESYRYPLTIRFIS